jgi:hypothetical protein
LLNIKALPSYERRKGRRNKQTVRQTGGNLERRREGERKEGEIIFPSHKRSLGSKTTMIFRPTPGEGRGREKEIQTDRD